MRYVILRDDDTNAFTPSECLERLYRPFLERGLPVNLATIPGVRTDATRANGLREGFLPARNGDALSTRAMTDNPELVRYLRTNPGYHIVQHGCDHSFNEFDSARPEEIRRKLERGAQLLRDAGFPEPQTFVAPYDKLSRASLREVAKRFRVLSTGWFELRRLPVSWWPAYGVKKALRKSHWHLGRTTLLTHPGCLLSHQRAYDTMLEEIKKSVPSRRLTVLVTHWWEYFRDGEPDERFIGVLHETAHWLGEQKDIQVISFDDVAQGRAPLN